jgi:pimeloyl-ACP methyl ester carboxylesterase
MESKFISTSFGRLHTQIAGAGNVVLLIHGYSTQHNSWRTWDQNIAALAAHARVYAPDLLGYGESDKPEPRLDAEDEAKALIDLLDAEKIARASLIGLSWGGGIAQMIVTTVPERVAKLVLVDSAYAEDDEGLARLKAIKCPTLIVWDEDDVVIPVAGARVLAKAIPQSRVRIFRRAERDPDADPKNRHWSQVTHSREWNKVVTEFLRMDS